MPQLQNAKHENFCAAIVRGLSISSAAVEAGFKPNNAAITGSVVHKRPDVKARIAELREEIASGKVAPTSLRAEVLVPTDLPKNATPAWIEQRFIRLAEEARQVGDRSGEAKVLVELGKIKGMYIERTMAVKSPFESLPPETVDRLLEMISRLEEEEKRDAAAITIAAVPVSAEGNAE
jgi:hypothetical protein